MKKRFLVGVTCLSMLCGFAMPVQAAPIAIDATKWLYENAPSSGRLSEQDYWIRLQSNTPTKTGNSSGALVSDFVLDGDFSFSGSFTPTYATNASCERNNVCNDDDIIGLVFGWQNEFNHFRLGWGQGGIADITGKKGLFIIQEVDGISNTIAHWDQLFWRDEQSYSFSIERLGDQFTINLIGAAQGIEGSQTAEGVEPNTGEVVTEQPLLDWTFVSNAFQTGKVGIYTESQTGQFNLENVTGIALSAPPIAILVVGAFAFAVRRQSRREA